MQVLVHRPTATPRTLLIARVARFLPHCPVFFLCLILQIFLCHVHAQILVGGQVFTDGLSIVDAPQPNSYKHPHLRHIG